jgi:hypothetical protein
MIKTLRITSILVAFLAAGLLVFPAFFGLRGNKKVAEFLRLPSVVGKFRKAQRGRAKTTDQESPLVAQANIFALYLDPPKVVKKKKEPRDKKVGSPPVTEVVKKTYHSTRFKVVATSFYAAQPESSLALIDEPGAGRYWVRQGDVVSHLTIEEIKDGIVVARGGAKVFEQPVQLRPPRRSLEGGLSPVSTGTIGGIGSETVAVSPAKTVSATAPGTGTTGPRKQQMSAKERAEGAKMLQQLLEMAMAAEGKTGSGETDSGAKSKEGSGDVEDIIPDVEDMRITGKEAKNLRRLGQELKDGQIDPNRPKSKKVEKSSTEGNKPKKSSRPKPKGRPSSSAGSKAKKSR